jgi:ComF family protein
MNNYKNDELHINNANALLDIKKNEKYRLILHQIKYRSMLKMGFGMGKLLGKKLITDKMNDYDLIAPVPVHKIRLRERGYNQAEIIALGVAEFTNIKMIKDLLIRKNYNISQTKLSASERTLNVKKSFVLNDKQQINKKKILLIDDIITTGSTLNNCALVLMDNGAKK